MPNQTSLACWSTQQPLISFATHLSFFFFEGLYSQKITNFVSELFSGFNLKKSFAHSYFAVIFLSNLSCSSLILLIIYLIKLFSVNT